MQIKSKYLIIVLCLLLLGASVMMSFAYENDVYSSLLSEDRQSTKTFIDNWLDTVYKQDGTKIDNITRMYNSDDRISGYIIDFSKNGVPNGYIVLDKQSDNPIKEFAFNGDSITDRLESNTNTSLNNLKIYNSAFNYLAMKTKSKINAFYDIYQRNFANKNAVLKSSAPLKDLIFFPGDIIDTSKSVDLPNIMYFNASTTGDFPGKNNCGSTAVKNILNWATFTGKLSSYVDYDEIITTMNFNDKNSTDIQCLEAIKKIAKNHDRKAIVNAYWLDYFSDFKRDINAQKPIFLGVLTKSGDGHAMVVCGYVEMPSGAKYLRVMDGWNKVITRFIEFNKSNYWKFDGASVEIK